MIIGIGGVSRAGKTTLAKQLEKKLTKERKSVDIFSLDDFVKPKVALPKVQGTPDWERPNSIKWDALTRAVERSEADIKILEGLFVFYPASLRSEFDLKVFLEIDKETFKNRRSKEKRWGDEPDWYADHVWKSYLKYGVIKDDKSDYVVLDGTQKINIESLLTNAAA